MGWNGNIWNQYLFGYFSNFLAKILTWLVEARSHWKGKFFTRWLFSSFAWLQIDIASWVTNRKSDSKGTFITIHVLTISDHILTKVSSRLACQSWDHKRESMKIFWFLCFAHVVSRIARQSIDEKRMLMEHA